MPTSINACARGQKQRSDHNIVSRDSRVRSHPDGVLMAVDERESGETNLADAKTKVKLTRCRTAGQLARGAEAVRPNRQTSAMN
jgi:hypothetical protein